MRHFLGGFCALVALGVAGGADAAAASDVGAPAQRALAAPLVRTSSAGCLGGVLNEAPTHDYLTVADYPAFAASVLRILICGDSVPPYLPAGQNTGGFPRRR